MNFKMGMICLYLKAICGRTVFPFIGAPNVEMNAEFAMPAPNGRNFVTKLYGATLTRNFTAQLCS